MSTAETRQAQLHSMARASVTEGLAKKNCDAIPYDDNVTLRAPLCPGGSEVPLTWKDNLRRVWWVSLPQLLGVTACTPSRQAHSPCHSPPANR